MMKIRLSLLMFSVLSLAGCDLYEEGHVTENRIQVEESQFVEKIPAIELSSDYVAALASQYERYGDGGVDLTLTYDPESRSNTAMNASTHASRIVSAFKKNGVTDINANILPVRNSGDVSTALLTYTAYNALAPKDCGVLAGVDNTAVDVDEEYRLGCSVETLFAKQIARPKDLKGQGVNSNTDGRRSSNIVERYRSGVPNQSLEGESSSGL